MIMPDNVKAKEREMFVAVWEFRKKFYGPESTDDYWRSVVSEAEELSKKYKNFYMNMMLKAVVDDIERRSKKK